jgi:CMP-N-acetylneuraminic acid synthetase
MADLVPGASAYARRQDVPDVFRINGSLYVWRAAFVRRETTDWRRGQLLMHEIPESRAINIDDLDEFRRAELMIREGRVTLPWVPA